MPTTKEQQRSEFALEITGEINITKDISNFIVGTPTMILQNGLGQTMAFLLSKGNGKGKDEKHNIVFNAIVRWCHAGDNKILSNERDFFGDISGLEQSDYIALQNEVLKMLQWLKRYARAFEVKGEN